MRICKKQSIGLVALFLFFLVLYATYSYSVSILGAKVVCTVADSDAMKIRSLIDFLNDPFPSLGSDTSVNVYFLEEVIRERLSICCNRSEAMFLISQYRENEDYYVYGSVYSFGFENDGVFYGFEMKVDGSIGAVFVKFN